jgi:hypothetical protein
MQQVQEEATGGGVGIAALGLVGEQAVQRREAKGAGAGLRRTLDEAGEVREIADAPIAAGADRMQLGDDPPGPGVCLKGIRQVAATGGDDQGRDGRRAFGGGELGDLEAMVSGDSGVR